MGDRSGTHLYLVLMKAHRTMARHAHRSIAAHDLGFSDFTILEALLHKGPMLVNEIGRRIELTSGSITTAVDRLEARGLVERSADADDRRARQVSLTRSGRALITRIFDRHRSVLDAAADGLKRAEREQLIALLKKLGLSAQAKLRDESGEDGASELEMIRRPRAQRPASLRSLPRSAPYRLIAPPKPIRRV